MPYKGGELFSQSGSWGFLTTIDVVMVRTQEIRNVNGISPFIFFLICLLLERLAAIDHKPCPYKVTVQSQQSSHRHMPESLTHGALQKHYLTFKEFRKDARAEL